MATKDGVDFQHHLYYYVIGLVHNTYDYSILYEGNVGRNQGTYKALDDVILKVHPNRERGHNEGLYLFQAKQRMDESLTLSIQDMLHHKVKISKYIDSYVQYSKSEACSRDGKPTEMIYWTSDGLHSTTLAFMEEHTSKEPHLKLTIDTIGKYSIKHWKALLMFDTAQKLANHCTLSKQDMSKPQTYLSKAMAQSFAHEIIEMMEPTAKSEQTEQPIVKFREQFLQGSTRLSENAKQFRLSFIIACQMQHKNPNTKFDLSSLRTVTFSTDAFQMQNLNAESAELCGFQYNGLQEDELNWFFEHFIFYVNVPKNEKMITAINNLFHNQWDEQMFHKYLIKDRPETKKDKKLQQVKALFENTVRGKFDEMDKLHVLAKELIQKEFYAKHSQLACELEYNCCNNPKQYEQMAYFGLIMIQLDASECVDFMHRTVMEYFLVRNCLLDDVDREMFFNFLRRYFCVSRANIADKFIDFFLHDLKCLTSHKKHIISSYLYSSSNILATCIRMALNNATFNTLRMLLSVAPKELLRSVHFRFGGTNNPQGNQFDEKNEINLKRLGERQTILLLETLKECDDEYDDADNESDDENEDRSILQRMLFETNPDEEDTLEVALRKPFPELNT
uniref:Uncharacterized protein n=1 Tax=Anopheles arabiensis TaxID=7173 RepID=A0A182HQI7_ANOAR